MKRLLMGLMLAAALSGCGGGGGGGTTSTTPTTPTVTPLVKVVANSAGNYTVQGDNMDGVAGMDIVVTYDNATLSTPTVTQGSLVSGALFAANPNFAPNAVKIGIVGTQAFKGSGPIAQIVFSTSQANAATPTVTSNLIDVNGNQVGG